MEEAFKTDSFHENSPEAAGDGSLSFLTAGAAEDAAGAGFFPSHEKSSREWEIL